MSTAHRATFALALLVASCGGTTESQSSSANGDGGTSDVEIDEGRPNPTCFVDSPCRPGEDKACVSDTEYVALVSYHCSHVCGNEPCSGGTCEREGDPIACPDGERCIPGDGMEVAYCGVPDAGTECGDGFCRELVASSCGDPGYEAIPMWSCTTEGGAEGYCCQPGSSCGLGGYCASEGCHAGFVMTQMGCDLDGGAGSCCVPED